MIFLSLDWYYWLLIWLISGVWVYVFMYVGCTDNTTFTKEIQDSEKEREALERIRNGSHSS